jgi:subtilisin family serine protease
LHGLDSHSQNDAERGWHLRATNLKQAWNISKGNPNIVIAIVDDGFDITHNMLKGRFFKAYNVFTQNRTLGVGEGHGTHVTGLAAGSADNFSRGAAGVAPNCKIMPIQVFDNEMCTFSSIASGIMYYIHNGANVVNISIGPSFKGLDQMPISEQKKVAETYFKNEERVYQHIIETANKKNVILVFAAGNDNIMTAILPECRETSKTVNVAAVTPQLMAAAFTNYSIGTNISAPGVSIYSSFPYNSFKVLDGTSMAAPIVTGTIALMLSINPKLTVGQIIGILQQTGKSIENTIPPMLQIDKALHAVKNGKINKSPIASGSKDVANDGSETDPNPLHGTGGNADNYSELKTLLEQLKKQRADLDKKIDNIENKIK